MVELILIRHGETDANTKGKYNGITDDALNENGIEQAVKLKKAIKISDGNIVYSSPLKRALKTAEIITGQKTKIIKNSLLIERNFGIFENHTYKSAKKSYPDEWSKYSNNWIGYKIPEGETATEAFKRAEKFFDYVKNKSEKNSVFVVTHGGVIRNILALVLNLDIEGSFRFRIDNGSITRICFDKSGYGYIAGMNILPC